jgi:hypothetical protein
MARTRDACTPQPVGACQPHEATYETMKRKVETVMGHTLPEPRVTPTAIWLILLWVALPVLLAGALLDALVQLVFGVCTGLWCFV